MEPHKLEKTGFYIALYGIALILIWIGLFKFTPTEATAIKGLVENSPLMSWMYNVMSVTTVSRVVGTTEIITGILLALLPFSARAGFVGGVLSAITFFTTLTFLFSTPGAIKQVDGLWVPDGFLLKDLIALGVSIYAIAVSAKEANLFGVRKQKVAYTSIAASVPL